VRGQQMGSVPTIDIHNIENSKSRNFDFDFDFYDADAQESLRSSTILGRNDPASDVVLSWISSKKKELAISQIFLFGHIRGKLRRDARDV